MINFFQKIKKAYILILFMGPKNVGKKYSEITSKTEIYINIKQGLYDL